MGGAPKSLAYLIQGLDKRKYEPIVLCIKNGPVVDLFRASGAEVVVKNKKMFPFHGTTVSGMSFMLFVKNIIGALITLFRAPFILKKINPDIIHLNTTCLFMFALVSKKFVNKNTPVVSHIREPLLPNFFGSILRFFNEKYVDKLIAISEFDASCFKQTRPVIIPNFVNFDLYIKKKSDLRAKLGIAKEDIVFTFLSRISPSNGALELARTAKEIKSKIFHFLMVGYDKEDKSIYNNNVKSFASSNIHFVEMQNDVKEVLSITDVLVSPFTEPHFSRAVIEAGALQIPSIISNVGGLNEQVIHNTTGLIYELYNDKGLFDEINKMEDKKLREYLGKNAYEFAYTNFNSKFNIPKTVEVYNLFFNDK
ncbi:hypothetical protein GCM10022393_06490 [Aquimarina addita]|uniref:Glycosyltransferase involved in cell wall biosynthesis n=2 Tax=Aquimarina addita TaxID=870485 RepID=A0ABP7XB64_9FLAO